MSSSESKVNFFSKAFWKTRQGQITFCVMGMILSVIFLLWQFGGGLLGGISGAAGKKILEQDLKKLQQEHERLKAELAVQEAAAQRALKQFSGIWRAVDHGEPEVELRSMIEKTAKDMELRLNNISMVRRSSFNQELSLLEVDVALTSDLDTVMKFLLAIEKLEPKLYWKRFDCRSSNMFGMSVIQFNGTLRCGNDERPEAAAKRKAAAAVPATTENNSAAAAKSDDSSGGAK